MRERLMKIFMVFAAMSIAAALFGQAITSSVTGTVTDSTGAVIPGATVTVADRSQGINRVTTTNSTGAYLVPGIPSGTYNLTVEAKGFKTYHATGIVLRAAQKIRADVTMQVGAVATEVTVQGSNIGQVKTQTSELGGTVTGRQITQLELNGRNFAQLITLVPGVSNMSGQDEGTVGVSGSVAYSVNGGRTEYNNWEVDGVGVEDRGSSGTLNVYPSIDAIGETRVLTSNYSAQYGGDSSGTVITVLKSGTSQFHGDVYEFNRNEIFNARNWSDFTTGRGSYKKNDWGYTFGGPFYIPGHYNTSKTKTFFFWSQEWRREISPNSFDVQVPSAQERQGNFSDVCPNPNNAGSFADCPINPVTKAYYPGNMVPIDPNAQALMAMIPAPTTGSGSLSFFQANPSYPTSWREELVRVDQNITPNVRMMVHYIHDTWNTVEPTTLWSTASFPTINTDFAGPGTSFVTQLTASASPTLLNEFIFGYSADHIILNNVGAWKIPANFTMTGLFNNGFGGKLPGIASICCNTELGGGFGEDAGFINPANPNYNANPIYTFRDMVTKIDGNHNLMFGADFIADQKNEQNGNTPNNNGNLTFSTSSPITTGNAWADFLTGRVASYQQLNNELKYYNRYKIFAPFFEDDWHVSRRLTLNLGFRGDFFGAFYNKFHLESAFSPSAYTTSAAPQIDVSGNITGQAGALVPGVGNPFDGMRTCGVNGVPNTCLQGHLFNPAPRFGFAFDPTGHGTTAIRGGYGIYYDHMNGNEVGTESLEGSPPLALNPTQFNIIGYTNIGGGALNFPLNVTALPSQVIWPMVQQWNLDAQHQFGFHTVISVAYVGSKGTHLTDQRDLNQMFPVPLSQNPFGPGEPITPALCNAGANGAPYVVNGTTVTGQAAINLGVACGNDPNPYRPFVGLANITLLENGANSNYNALQVYMRKTVGPLNFSLAYTYSHSLDDSSDRYDGVFVNSYDLERSYASSNFDITHILNASYVYDFPFFQHASSRILRGTLGGWELSGITSFQTGTPFSINNGGITGVAGGAAGVGNGVGIGSYPDICGNINAAPPETNVPGINGPLLYNPGAFCAPRGLTFGNAGRNILRNPHYSDWDMGLFKDIPIHESMHLQFRAEVFNTFNTANIFITSQTATPGAVTTGCYQGANFSSGAPGCVSTTGFLQATSAHAPRIWQFSMKFLF